MGYGDVGVGTMYLGSVGMLEGVVGLELGISCNVYVTTARTYQYHYLLYSEL